MDIILVVSAIVGYLFGCIQASYFIGKFVRRIDIRQHGSTNSGASNVTMIMGLKWGLIAGFIDMLKASAAVWVVRAVYPGSDDALFIAGFFAVMGHIYPFFMGFRGGKGIASLIGMYLAVDWRFGLIILGIQVVASAVTDLVTTGSVILYLSLPFLTIYYGYSPTALYISLVLVVIGLYKHYPNMIRILKKEEPRIRAVLFKKK